MDKKAFAELSAYIDLLLDAICVVDEHNRFAFVSSGCERVFGYQSEEMLGRSMFEFMHPDWHDVTQRVAERVNNSREVIHFENRYIHKNGSIIDLHWSARWSEKDHMRIGVARDITAQKRLEQEREALIERLASMALTDSLTKLPNRSLLYDRISTARARAKRNNIGFGLLYLDLDDFKQINDEYGHACGDMLLQRIAERLQSVLRATDTLARLGGDEFVVLVETTLSSVSTEDAVNTVAKHILQALSQPIILPHGEHRVSTSIGAAIWPQHGDNSDALLHYADQTMYRAKREGGNGIGG